MKKRKDAKNITKSVSKKLFACLISRDILISKCFVWITLPDLIRQILKGKIELEWNLLTNFMNTYRLILA